MWSPYQKVHYNVTRLFTSPTLTFVASRRWVRLTAFLLKIHIQCLQEESGSGNSNRINALILPKAGFTEDALACFGGQENYAIYAMDRNLVKALFRAFLPIEIDDNNYRTAPARLEKEKLKLRGFWLEVLGILRRMLKIDLVCTGNYSYASEQEFAAACNRLGIPFVAMHKECLKTPGLEPFYQDIYQTRKNPFQGAKICVYNEIEARIQRGAHTTSPENIIITGMARMDRLHSLRRDLHASQGSRPRWPTVLFFSFNIKAGLPFIGRKLPQRFETLESSLERLNCQELARACHLAMFTLARDNPDIRVVIKTKGDTLSANTLRRFLGGDFTPPKNLEIMAGGDVSKILAESSVVCGFNTTALLEALALNKPVVIPRFYEAENPELVPYILDFEDAAEYADSVDQLTEMLRDTALRVESGEESGALGNTKARLLEKWVGNPDGRAGQRVRQVVEKVVYQHRKSH